MAEILLGFLTFTGSLMAAGKLQEIKWIPQRPVTYPLQNVSNIGLLAVAVLLGVWLVVDPVGPVGRVIFPAIIAWRCRSASCSSSRSAVRTCRPSFRS